MKVTLPCSVVVVCSQLCTVEVLHSALSHKNTSLEILCFLHSVQLSALGETPPGEDGAGGGVWARADWAAAAAGGRARRRGGGAQEGSLSRGRTPEGGASLGDGGAEDSATRTGDRKKGITGDFSFTLDVKSDQWVYVCVFRWRK